MAYYENKNKYPWPEKEHMFIFLEADFVHD